MKIIFATESLRNECNNQEALVKRLGPVRARILRQRLDELFNAESLGEIRSLPQLGLSRPPRSGDDLSFDLGDSFRLVIRPVGPAALDGDRGWNKVDSILILSLRGPDG